MKYIAERFLMSGILVCTKPIWGLGCDNFKLAFSCGHLKENYNTICSNITGWESANRLNIEYSTALRLTYSEAFHFFGWEAFQKDYCFQETWPLHILISGWVKILKQGRKQRVRFLQVCKRAHIEQITRYLAG